MKKTKYIIAGLMIAFLMFLNITIKQSSSKSELTFKFTQVLSAFSEQGGECRCNGVILCPLYHGVSFEANGTYDCCGKFTPDATGHVCN